MEQWENLLNQISAKENTQLDIQGLIKILQTASVLLNEDLAQFELEWILKSLLYKPINLLEVIVSKYRYDVWCKPIEDSFKLLSNAVTKYGEAMEFFYEPIVQVCQLSFEPGAEKQALDFLTCIAKYSSIAATNIQRYISSLEGATKCKASRALFIGAVCEYQPATVEREATRIWRICLNLLESNKNTDTVVTAVLRAILGLLKHFGKDLPIAELSDFYEKISTVYTKTTKCYSVVLSMLEHHAELFSTSIAGDTGLRRWLWSTLGDAAGAAALLSVYTVVFNVKRHSELVQDILRSEVEPRVGTNTLSTYTALRVRAAAQRAHRVQLDVENLPVVESLEFELRSGTVSKDVADSLAWSIECGLMNSDKLLQTSMMFYKNIPNSKLKEVIVYGTLKTTPEIRKASIIFLITETCQDDTSLDVYLPLWKLLFDTANGSDTIILESSKYIFEDFMDYGISQLKRAVENDMESIPEKLCNVMKLCAHVASAVYPEEYTQDRSTCCLRVVEQCIRRCGISSPTLACVRALLSHSEGLDDPVNFFTMISIEGCKDEALLCECCLLLILESGMYRVQDKLNAFQIILSRSDVEPKTLARVLHELGTFMSSDQLHGEDFSNIIYLIKKLRSRKHNMAPKDARILQRDIMLFLGKHGGNCEVFRDSREDLLMVELKNSLNLNLQDPIKGVTYQLNLVGILQTAVQEENTYILQTLLTIISAVLVSRKEPRVQSAVSLAVRALCRAHAHAHCAPADTAALHHALLLCDDLQPFYDIISYIRQERSAGVRRMLSDALESVMVSADAGREFTEQLITAVGEHVLLMMDAPDSLSRKAGLYLTETLVAVQNKNTAAVSSLLPQILLKITTTYNQESIGPLKYITEAFMEQIELHSTDKIEEIVRKLLEIITVRPTDTSFDTDKIYKKTVDLCLGFVRNIYEYKRWEVKSLLKVERGSCKVGRLYVLVHMRRVFGFSDDVVLEFLEFLTSDGIVEELSVVSVDSDVFVWETVFEVLAEFATVLVKSEREKTLKYLTSLTLKLTPDIITKTSKTLMTCYNKYRELCDGIPEADTSFQEWWNRLPMQTITDNIKSKCYSCQISMIVNSMKVMLKCFSKQSVNGDVVRSWPQLIFQAQRIVSNTFLEDSLTVALQFFSTDEVTKLLMEYMAKDESSTGQPNLMFLGVFFDHLQQESILDSLECGALLNDVVKWCQGKGSGECCEAVLRLVDKLWPQYEPQATFEQKVGLLLELGRLPVELSPTLAPLSWATTRLLEGGVSERIRLVGALPPGGEFSSAYKGFAALLPTRLRELSAGAGREAGPVLRALLDAAAASASLTLVNLIATLAAGDDTKGWWDEAMDSCMATLALKGDKSIYELVYNRCWEGLSTGVCDRLLVPLLRYSSSSFCEEFLSGILERLFGILEDVQKQPSAHFEYHKRVVDYTRALLIIQIAFEKIPHSLESPNTLLYRALNVEQMWYLVRQTCKLCVTLRDYVVCPPNAGDTLKISCRKFQCASYMCLSAAICCRKPTAKFYDVVFNAKAWSSIVDHDHVYRLPLRAHSVRKIRRAVGVDVSEASGLSSGSASGLASGSVRTRVFLRTLTDNPLHYDLIPLESQTVKPQEIALADTELNAHRCAGTVSALVAHAAALQHRGWLPALLSALVGDLHPNVKYLLAQAICNSKTDLAPHAAALAQPLFQFIVQTAEVVDSKSLLNGLHIDVLDTITSWRDDSSISDLTYLNSAVNSLISTIIDNNKYPDIHANLLQCLSRVLLVYGNRVTVKWSTFQPYFGDKPMEETKSCVSILSKVTKQGIDIPELAPALLSILKSDDWIQTSKRWGQLHKLASLFARADAGRCLNEYWTILDQFRRKDVTEYIKMLYYAQMECDKCCDLHNFKRITDLAPKLPRADKSKCLKILESYAGRQALPDTATLAMFDILKLDELVDSDYAVEAMDLVKSGLHLMGYELKRSLVRQVSGHCQNSLIKVRRAALGVMLKSLQELYPEEASSRKRQKRDTTPILDSVSSGDGYIHLVVTSLALGLTDEAAGAEGGTVRAELAKSLHDDLAIRFVECFVMTIYYPCMRSSNAGHRDLCLSISALIEMLLAGLRSQELFKKLKLRDTPLEISNTNSGPLKLLTMSKTYRGTYLSTKGQQNPVKQTKSDSSGIDVQLPVDNILEALLKFTKVNAEAAVSLCVEIAKAIKDSNSSGFDFNCTMSRLLSELLTKPEELTPLVVELCQVFIDELSLVDGIQKSLERLKEVTRGTEDEGIIKLLSEEVRLRNSGSDYFVLGSHRTDDTDIVMAVSSNRFSMEELITTFGKLSNWDDITLQEKNRIESTLPKIWAVNEDFISLLNNYAADNKTWLDKLVSCDRSKDLVQTLRCLKDFEKWPVNQFAISAMTELLDWDNSKDWGDMPICHDLNPFSFNMRRSDCMAEWAARLMLRQATRSHSLDESEREREREVSRSHELLWCVWANERNLPRQVLDCVNRNSATLSSEEAMSWLMQMIEARRTLALRENDLEGLNKILEKTVENYRRYEEESDLVGLLQMAKLLVQLTRDVRDSERKMYIYICESINWWKRMNKSDSTKHRWVLDSILSVAMSYYFELWEQSDTAGKNDLLVGMSKMMGQAIDHNPEQSEALVAVVLDCLDNWSGVSEDAARTVLQQLDKLPYHHPSVEDVRSHLHVFPPAVLSEFPKLSSRPDPAGRSAEMYRKCFQLVADAAYTLTQYCERLGSASKNNDREEWKNTFDMMKGKIFDNEFAGDDYRVLNKYKNELHELYDYDKTDARTKELTLRNIVVRLSAAPQSALRLSRLCPELSRGSLEPETGLSALLGLRPGLAVVSFRDQVRVMLGSVRRPCVVQARLSDGTTRRLLHKGGERLRADATALRAARLLAARSLSPSHTSSRSHTLFRYYQVIPLGDDSGLIEYLENFETLRTIISESHKLNQPVPGPTDSELILQSTQSSVQRHRKLCASIEPTALRSAIAKRSSCIQDYIEKKTKFLDSLAFMTILVWIIGVGDRHLENIMYSVCEGTVCNVDWAALMQYGNPMELAPARLTRNLLAVCDFQVLESRMQGILRSLRDSHALLLPTLKVIFKWMGDEFNTKFRYMAGILRGDMLSHEISTEVIKNSNGIYKDKYIQLFGNVFGAHENKQNYTVEEQVSNLFQHCTDERILSVVRSGWEPWI